jgi:hypothetical protein
LLIRPFKASVCKLTSNLDQGVAVKIRKTKDVEIDVSDETLKFDVRKIPPPDSTGSAMSEEH